MQRAPKLYNIASYVVYFIFHPEAISKFWRDKIDQETWDARGCGVDKGSLIFSSDFISKLNNFQQHERRFFLQVKYRTVCDTTFFAVFDKLGLS